jgi:hypothetical protein
LIFAIGFPQPHADMKKRRHHITGAVECNLSRTFGARVSIFVEFGGRFG